MTCYYITYTYKKHNSVWEHNALVDASALKFAKKKLERKHNVKKVTIIDYKVVGYY